MKLNPGEAYITKNNKIKFGDERDYPFLFLNPIKGSYKELRNRIMQILELNNDSILGILFDNKTTLWLSQIGVDTVEHENIIMYYDTYEETKNSVLINKDWKSYEKQIENCDIKIYKATRKGLLNPITYGN